VAEGVVFQIDGNVDAVVGIRATLGAGCALEMVLRIISGFAEPGWTLRGSQLASASPWRQSRIKGYPCATDVLECSDRLNWNEGQADLTSGPMLHLGDGALADDHVPGTCVVPFTVNTDDSRG
jgi:hypothetical protein